MEERAAAGEAPAAARKGRDLGPLLLLLTLAVALRAAVVWRTEVAARDSIGYIRHALEFEKLGWKEVLCKNHQHPGYPLTVLAVSLPLRALAVAAECDLMQLSAQLASALAGVLLVFPLFYLGKELFDRAVGFWAALLFQCLPVSGHVLSDGLSEALFLLLSATALLLATRALRGSAPGRFALCGAACGLTYLTRPEGALGAAAALMVLLGMQAVPGWRRPWRRALACGAALLLAAAAVGSPYVLTTGHFTIKPSARVILGAPERGADDRGAAAARPAALTASVLGVWLPKDGTGPQRLRRSLWGLGTELVKACHYVAWFPALLGMWWYRGKARVEPGAWAVLVLCLLHALVLLRLAVVVGYVSDRHVLLLVLCGTLPAVAAVRDVPRHLAAWAGRPAGGGVAVGSLVLLLGLTAAGLPKTLQPLHGNRAGHHAAGRWLAEHADPADAIRDDHCWAHYYAGRVFLEGRAVPAPPGHRPTCYFVVGRRDAGREPRQGQPLSDKEIEQVRAHGEIVFSWPAGRPSDRADVVVYAVPLAAAGGVP